MKRSTVQAAATAQKSWAAAGTLLAYGSESTTNHRVIGFAEMIATYDWFLEFLDRLDQVTPDDVQRMVGIISIRNRITGLYLPNELEGSRLES